MLTEEHRAALTNGIKIGIFALVVEVAALVTMAWQHQAQALTGLVLGIVLIAGSLCALFYQLGKRQ